MITFNIEIVSDPICSWCFIAHRALEKTVRLYRTTIPDGLADEFNITYLPYYLLDPTLPSRNKTNFESVIALRKHQNLTYNRIMQIGRSYGISFNFFEGKIGGTREAHRLIQLVQSRRGAEVRDRVIDRICSAFHERAMDITNQEVLRSIAIDAGVGVEEADGWMDKDIGGEELEVQLKRARNLVGAENKGVPVVIVQGQVRFDGAPDISELLGTLVSIRDGMVEKNVDLQGQASTDRC
ncbi:conserved hypothetical protein [Talaromyces stipitatus ATCC 10500]|uniref:DSBA-like thioredoxin domain-containing protein n=1 Tax=Talaromyces stipitatus (strain ATCC 10500 / CBS 375.48 / QM 6759 / NRRL 1006) TaxID=441959 RepID=B8M0S3_TALSN|nr:uncharacterized protein TSTA_086890 [Talaromyces stipitatus ATCC 10500]EED21456.1 conserved hypothetical protein [Talaromyces stipitatus ATCC 10500]